MLIDFFRFFFFIKLYKHVNGPISPLKFGNAKHLLNTANNSKRKCDAAKITSKNVSRHYNIWASKGVIPRLACESVESR